MAPAPEPEAPRLATRLGVVSWRPRTDADTGLLRALFASSRQAELAMLGGDLEQQTAFVDLQLRAREHHRDATRPGAALAIVTLDDIAVGQLDLHDTDEAREILEIALVPGLRGHGLGTALLTRVLGDAGERAVRLHVEPHNPARRLYERLGFVVVGTEAMHLAMERPAGGAFPAPAAPTGRGGSAPPRAGDAPPDPEGLERMPTYEELAPRIGATVAVLPDGPDLELVAVDLRPRRRPEERVPFSALLAGPLDRQLEQGTYRLDVPGPGPTDLFIVPLAPADGRAVYELIVA